MYASSDVHMTTRLGVSRGQDRVRGRGRDSDRDRDKVRVRVREHKIEL